MTFGEFLDYEYGYNYRIAESWDETRNLMWASLSAFGGNNKLAKDLFPLWIDKLGNNKNSQDDEFLSDEVIKKWVDSLEYGEL